MVNYNGTLTPDDQHLFKPGNRAFLYADRIFETIRYQNGRLLFWEDHYFRMMGGACILRMDIPNHLNMDFLEAEILKTLESSGLKSSSARVRLSIHRVDGGLYLPTNNTFKYLVEVTETDTHAYELNAKGLVLDVFYDHLKPKQALSNFKGGNSMISVLSSIYAKENDLNESIILNSESNLCETTASNLFVVSEKTIYTPPIDSGCVDGVIRKNILENGSSWGYSLVEKDMKPFELITADEVFITNSVKGIQWVSNYKNKAYGSKIIEDLFSKFLAQTKA